MAPFIYILIGFIVISIAEYQDYIHSSRFQQSQTNIDNNNEHLHIA